MKSIIKYILITIIGVLLILIFIMWNQHKELLKENEKLAFVNKNLTHTRNQLSNANETLAKDNRELERLRTDLKKLIKKYDVVKERLSEREEADQLTKEFAELYSKGEWSDYEFQTMLKTFPFADYNSTYELTRLGKEDILYSLWKSDNYICNEDLFAMMMFSDGALSEMVSVLVHERFMEDSLGVVTDLASKSEEIQGQFNSFLGFETCYSVESCDKIIAIVEEYLNSNTIEAPVKECFLKLRVELENYIENQ